MAVILDYISKGGVPIKVNDASMGTPQEEIDQAYRNWGQIARSVYLRREKMKEAENAKKQEKGKPS